MQSKKLDIRSYFSKGTYIDVKDTDNKWLVACITDLSESDNTLSITFDGWNTRWDETLKFTSSRIAPFRKYSKGYTGVKNICHRKWQFSLSELQQNQTLIENYIQKDFEGFNSFYITQTLRGTYYIFIDNILVNLYERKEKDVFSKIFELFVLHIKLTSHFLKKLSSLFNEFVKGNSNNEVFLTDDNVALALCLSEIVDTTIRILGLGGERYSKFYKDYSSFLVSIVSPESSNNGFSYNQEDAKTLRRILIEKFIDFGGMNFILKMLTLEEGAGLIPFKCMKHLLQLLLAMLDELPISEKKTTQILIKKVIFQRIEMVNEKEIKDFQKEEAFSLINDCYHILSDVIPEEELNKNIEKLELELSLKYLKSPFFEKKLKGLSDIKDIMEKVEYSSREYSFYNSYKKKYHYITVDIFLKWLADNKVVEFLLGESMHLELVKRCGDILTFLCKHKKLTSQLLLHIWNSCEGKHDSIVRGIYEVLVELTIYLEADSIAILYQKIKAIPLENYNELSLSLLKGFCENAMKSGETYRIDSLSDQIEESKLDSRFFGVIILWRLIQDDSPLPLELLEQTLNNFRNILLSHYGCALRKYFLARCFEEVRKNNSVPQCLSIVAALCQNLGDTRSTLKQMQKQHDLIGIILEDMRKYCGEREGKGDGGFMEYVFKGKFNHRVNLEKRFLMIEYLVDCFATEILTTQHLELLWSLFVINPRDESEKQFYLKWINKQDGVLLSKPDLVLYQFNKICCNKEKTDFFNLSEEEFDCFANFFKSANMITKKIKLNRSGKFNILDQDLLGKQTIWDIFLNVKNKSSIEKVVDLLADVHLKFHEQMDKTKKKEIYETFLTKCLNYVKKSYENQNKALTNKSISLIATFFDKYEGNEKTSKTQNSDTNRYSYNATVLLKPDEIKKEVRVFYTEKASAFRKRISEEFNIPFNSFRFITKNEVRDMNDEDLSIKDFGMSGTYIIQKIRKVESEEDSSYHPKHLISESQEHLDMLFTLISNPNSVESLNEIWDLLMKLPVNEKIQKTIIENSQPWSSILDVGCLYKTLYNLQILEELTFTTKYKNASEWRNKFISTDGFKYLLELYVLQTFNEKMNFMTKKYLLILLKLINYYLKKHKLPETYAEVNSNQINLFLKTLETLHYLSEYTILREKDNLENCSFEKQKCIEEQNERHSNYEETIPKIPDFFKIEQEIASLCGTLMTSLLELNLNLLENLFTYPKLESLISNGLIKSDNLHLQRNLELIFRKVLSYKQEADKPDPKDFFLSLLFSSIFSSVLTHIQSDSYFRLLELCILGSSPQFLSESLLREKTTEIFSFLKENDHFEKAHSDTSCVLSGLLISLRALFMKIGANNIEPHIRMELLEELIGPCLFETPSPELKKKMLPKCKSMQSRSAAFDLVELLCQTNEIMDEVLKYFAPIHKNADWRTKSYSDWYIVPKRDEKSVTGYVGLKNLGCICYMNSLLQQFYMIPTFRRSLLEAKDMLAAKSSKEDNPFHQIKCLFLALKESEKQYHNPRHFCQAFKDWEGNPTNVYEQRDVDEFCNMFFDRLESSVKGSSHENFIKKHFGGVLSNEFICRDCPHYSEREEQFLAVSLQVKNKKSIAESLASFVEGEMLEGDNAYLCEKCNKKVATLKRVCLKKLPKHLILVLKRFEFDFDTMTKVKVNDSCEFPMTINFEKYTQQGLRKQDKDKKNNESSEKTYENETHYPPEYFEYQLKGIVIHMGVADSGHYYSLIQERENNNGDQKNFKWLELNDTLIKYFDEKDIPNEAFGGEEKWSYYGGGGTSNMISMKEKIKNAYLLFYDRIVPFEEEISEKTTMNQEESKEENSTLETPTKPEDETKEFLEEIRLENHKFHLHKNIFGLEYFHFVTKLVESHQFDANSDVLEVPFVYDKSKNKKAYYDLEILKLGILFFLTSVVREKERNSLNLIVTLKAQLKKNTPASQWLIYGFCNHKIIEEFLLTCVDKTVKEFVIGLLKVAIEKLYKIEISYLANTILLQERKSEKLILLPFFYDLLIDMIPYSKGYLMDYTEFFGLFLFLTKLGKEGANYLLEKQIVGKLIEFGYGSKDEFFLKKKDESKFNEIADSPLGTPNEVQKKILSSFDQLKQKKKQKSFIEAYEGTANKAFVWATLAELVKLCQIEKTDENNKNKTFIINEKGFFLSPEEYASLKASDAETLFKCFCEAKFKIAIRGLAGLQSMLCFEDLKYSDLLIHVLKKGLKEKTTAEFRPFFSIIKSIISLEDSLQEYRIEKIVEHYHIILNENVKYYSESSVLQEFLIKMCERNKKLCQEVTKNQDKYNFIVDYINKNEINSYNTEHLKLLNSKTLSYNRFSHPRNGSEYIIYSEIKMKKIKSILRGDMISKPEEWDSDDDIADHEFVLKEKLDYCYYPLSGRWLTAEVESIMEEMIQLKLSVGGKDETVWVNRTSEAIAPYGKMQAANNYEEKANGSDKKTNKKE